MLSANRQTYDLVNEERLIFEIDESYWIEYEGLEEKLVSESVIEAEKEIDDSFGKFGFKNKAGEFVIEPQYAYANEFTCGLAAVNLNRTWYKAEDGRRLYENHFGYINHLGKTVIPLCMTRLLHSTSTESLLLQNQEITEH